MKDLRQLVRRSGVLAAGKRRRRLSNSRRSDATSRRLQSETLEKRNLLAGGILASQNINPYDVNDDQMISVRDALVVVNFLARGAAEGEQSGSGGLTSSSNGTSGFHYDVNGDSQVTAADALGVINALMRAEGEPLISPITKTFTEESVFEIVDLLEGQVANGSEFTGVFIQGVTVTGNINVVVNDVINPDPPPAGEETPVAFNGGQANVVVFPREFIELNETESSEITINYEIEDAGGNRFANDATITITGVTQQEIEYILSARELDDTEIPAQNGVVSVTPDEPFYLQIAYEDFRPDSLDKDLGAFRFVTNLTFQDGDGDASSITPILFESQRLEVENDILPGVFSRLVFEIPTAAPVPGGGVTSFEVLEADVLSGNFSELLSDALVAFGYGESQFRIDDDQGASLIVYDDPNLGNMDLPDVTATFFDNNGDPIPQNDLFRPFVSATSTPPVLNGMPNSAAVPVSIEYRSNTFNNPTGGFGTPFYSRLLDSDLGSYDAAQGFFGVGGLGGVPGRGGGIPELGAFIEPFDSLSLLVKIEQQDVDVTASIAPAITENEFLLLYGYDNQRIPENILTESTDSNGNGVSQLVLSTSTPNLPPEVTGEVSAIFSEDDTPVPFTVDLLTGATDPDGDDAGLTIRDLTLFEGDPRGITPDGTDLLVDPSQYGFLDVNESEVIIYDYTIVDVRGGTVAQRATVTITGEFDANLPPVIQSGQQFEIQENSPQDTFVGNVIATDPEQGPLTYEIIGGNVGGAFQIDDAGDLTVLTESAVDFDTTPVFTLSIQVTDNAQLTDVEDVTVNLTDINESPIFVDQNKALPETTQLNDVFATLDGTDPEGVPLVYTLISGNDDGDLALSTDGQLSLATDEPLVVGVFYTLTVEASDGVNDPVSAVVTVTVTDEPQPPAVSDSTFTVDENVANDTLVGTVQAQDPDGNDGLVYTILNGNDAGDFTLDSTNGEIRVAGDINFEDIDSYTLTVQVTDPGGLNGTGTITINVNDLNEAPVVEDQLFVVPEDLAIGGTVGTIQATDPDGDTLEYTITGGDDDNVFSLDLNSGLLTTNQALDFETVSNYTLDVTVSDGEFGPTADITITITDVNEAPVFDADIDLTFSEDDDMQAIDLLNGVTDPEGFNNSLTIENLTLISGLGIGITPDGTDLDLDPNANGDLVDEETRVSIYTYDIVDIGDASATRTATIRVTGVNDAPNARDDSRSAIVDQVVTINVLDNDDVGDGEVGTPVLVTAALDAASEVNADLTFDTTAGTVTITPELGYEGPINFTYTITDAQNNPIERSADGSIIYRNFDVSTISGMVFEDHLENGIDVILNGADEFRNGIKEDDEAGIAGLTVHLFSAAGDNVTGEEVSMTATTDMDGAYTFGNLPPGEFQLELLDVDPDLLNPLEDALKFARTGGVLSVAGTAVQTVSIDNPLGGEMITGVDWHVVAKDPGLDTNNLIASGNRDGIRDDNGNQKGLFALLDRSGMQVYVGVQVGYDQADMVTVSYDRDNDRALLEVLAEGDTFTRVLADDEFVLTDGDKLQVFGGLDDLFSDSSNGNDSFLGSSNNS